MLSLKKISIPCKMRHNIFLLQKKERLYLGYRRKISEDSRYSILEKEMLMGEIVRAEENTDPLVFFISHPTDNSWRTAVFHGEKDINIHFPWPPQNRWGGEAICPEKFWDNSATKPSVLDDEEKHFREHSIGVLEKIIFNGCHIYDPACSTGRFLSSIQENYTSCIYSASDRSEKMVSLARSCLPNVFVFNIIEAEVTEHYDIIFCRFANHEVIETTSASNLLTKLLMMLNYGGYLILFGHTPVACDIRRFAKNSDVRMKMRVGRSRKPDGLFQYYVLKK